MTGRIRRVASDVIADVMATREARREIPARRRHDTRAARQEPDEPDLAHEKHLAEIERALSHFEQNLA